MVHDAVVCGCVLHECIVSRIRWITRGRRRFPSTFHKQYPQVTGLIKGPLCVRMSSRTVWRETHDLDLITVRCHNPITVHIKSDFRPIFVGRMSQLVRFHLVLITHIGCGGIGEHGCIVSRIRRVTRGRRRFP